MGIAFSLLGIVGQFVPVQNIVNILAGMQGAWWLAAAITLIVRVPLAEHPATGAVAD